MAACHHNLNQNVTADYNRICDRILNPNFIFICVHFKHLHFLLLIAVHAPSCFHTALSVSKVPSMNHRIIFSIILSPSSSCREYRSGGPEAR